MSPEAAARRGSVSTRARASNHAGAPSGWYTQASKPSSKSSSAWRYAVLIPPVSSSFANGQRKMIRATVTLHQLRSAQGSVDLLQRRRSGTQLLLGQAIERHVHRVERRVHVAGRRVHIDEACYDFAGCRTLLHIGHGAYPI